MVWKDLEIDKFYFKKRDVVDLCSVKPLKACITQYANYENKLKFRLTDAEEEILYRSHANVFAFIMMVNLNKLPEKNLALIDTFLVLVNQDFRTDDIYLDLMNQQIKDFLQPYLTNAYQNASL